MTEWLFGLHSCRAALIAAGRSRARHMQTKGVNHAGINAANANITGNAPVDAAGDRKPLLSGSRSRLHRLVLVRPSEELVALARTAGVPVQVVNDIKNLPVGARKHHNDAVAQGCFVEAEPLRVLNIASLARLAEPDNHIETKTIDEWMDSLTREVRTKMRLWCALDRTQDPVNFGAIMRTCAFFGVPLVFQPRNNAPLSPVASRASVGSMENMKLFETHNVATFLGASRSAGWNVLATALDAPLTLRELVVQHPVVRTGPTILVLGNEGAGLRSRIIGLSTHRARIAPSVTSLESPSVDSLNVQVACGVLLNSLS